MKSVASTSPHVSTIRRVLRGQWANRDARLKALAALTDLDAERRLLQMERDDFEQRLHAYKRGEHV